MSGSPSLPTLDADRLAELGALLRLNQQAIAMYAAAIPKLTNVGRRQTLLRFRADHQRVADELAAAIRQAGGTPAEAPADLGRTVAALAGGEQAVMTAICRHARRARAQFLRVADRVEGLPDALGERLTAAADDIARQCEWADSQLEALGGRLPKLDRVPGIDRARRGLEWGAEFGREHRPSNRALAVAAVAAGIGFAVVTSVEVLRARR